MEIERRFLLRGVPAQCLASPRQALRQGYLAVDAGSEVRIREMGGEYSLTAKRGSGLVRDEAEVLISAAAFERLWPLTDGRRIHKRRLQADMAGAALFIDEYLEPVHFFLAEVEFDSAASASGFFPPDWFGPEVTDIATMHRFSELLEAVRQWQESVAS